MFMLISCQRRSHFVSITLICVLLNSSVYAQIVNYDHLGKKFNATTEKVILLVDTVNIANKTRGATPSISLPGIVGSVFSLVIDATKTILTSQEAKYTATYSATVSEKGLIKKKPDQSSPILNISGIHLLRITTDKNGFKDTSTRLTLVPVTEGKSGLFRFKVDSLDMKYSKAKIKRWGRRGKTLDISISLKLDAIWTDATTPTAGHLSDTTSQIKTQTLGESSILIQAVEPTNKADIDKDLYSGWFQLPPQSALKFATIDNNYSVGFYNLTVTIKEANAYGIDSKQLADFLGATSSDMSNVLKQLVPTLSK